MKLKEIRQLRTFRKQSDFRDSHFQDSPKHYLHDLIHHFAVLKEFLLGLIDQFLNLFAALL
jgi:hypothetical protein